MERLVVIGSFSLYWITAAAAGTESVLEVELDHLVQLPAVKVDGQPIRIHTQGLFVDAWHIYVTGRLESRPKRPLLVRFERANPARYEVLDLTLHESEGPTGQLDHPGGFDFDGRDFWIPVARSKPAGPSAIVRIRRDTTRPLREWSPQVAFVVDDHIGAIAFERASQRLYGANWDTRNIHIWQADGTPLETITRDAWIRTEPKWHIAVQDWKGVTSDWIGSPGAIVASGIDKSLSRDRNQSPARIEFYSPDRRERLARVHLPSAPGRSGLLTREGMCLHGNWLVLLPDDLSEGANLYFYRPVRPSIP